MHWTGKGKCWDPRWRPAERNSVTTIKHWAATVSSCGHWWDEKRVGAESGELGWPEGQSCSLETQMMGKEARKSSSSWEWVGLRKAKEERKWEKWDGMLLLCMSLLWKAEKKGARVHIWPFSLLLNPEPSNLWKVIVELMSGLGSSSPCLMGKWSCGGSSSEEGIVLSSTLPMGPGVIQQGHLWGWGWISLWP